MSDCNTAVWHILFNKICYLWKIADLIKDKAPGNAAHIESSAAFLIYCIDYSNIKLSFNIEGGEFEGVGGGEKPVKIKKIQKIIDKIELLVYNVKVIQ